MRLIDVDLYCATICKCNRRACDRAKCPIHNAPTAYSVDKVVEELEENSSRYTKKYLTPYGNNGYRDTKAISIHKAIEIVKHGGVSEDVCEWKSASDGEFIQNPHTKRLYSNEPSVKNIYCNTCGNKIKIVGD